MGDGGGSGISGRRFWHYEDALAYRGRACAGGHAFVVQFNARRLIAAEDLAKGNAEFRFEMIHPLVIGAELFLEGSPRNEGGLTEVDAVQPLRKPCVNVEAHSRVRKRRKVGFVERHC